MRFGLHDTRGCSEFGLKNNGILYTVRSNHDISHRLGRLVGEKLFWVLYSSAKSQQNESYCICLNSSFVTSGPAIHVTHFPKIASTSITNVCYSLVPSTRTRNPFDSNLLTVVDIIIAYHGIVCTNYKSTMTVKLDLSAVRNWK